MSGLFDRIARHRRPKSPEAARRAPETDGYERLRRIARRYLRYHRRGELMQTTVLAHEVWLRIRSTLEPGETRDLKHAANAIRSVLVDEARREGSATGGGAWRRISLNDSTPESGSSWVDLLDLDAAISALELSHPRAARIVELRFFGGLSVRETAQLLEIGERTVESEFRLARAILRVKLEGR
jgi:RNA polymerase sigma factor (TIGR02999 family)